MSSFPGVQYGQLLYRRCDNFKSQALKEHRGNYNAQIKLNSECKEDLLWWIENIESVSKKVDPPPPAFQLESNASKQGWGGCMVSENNRDSTGGNWSEIERTKHINQLELLAAWFTI